MSDYAKLQTRCQRGEASLAGANNLLAECHAALGKLIAENEALRRERDARHPFKPFHEPAISFTGCVICGMYTDHGGLPCPKMRATATADLADTRSGQVGFGMEEGGQ